VRALQKSFVNISFERTLDPPRGLEGGLPGAAGHAILRRAADGSEETIVKRTQVPIEPGDTVTFLTPGGGGYGDPRERDRATLAREIDEGLISAEAAASAYGLRSGVAAS
jgi:N-methylhydantoinase B